MNTTYALLLFLAAFIPGLITIFSKKPLKYHSEYLLVFAGTYIFSITILHLIPEIFSNTSHPEKMALFVLAGFFMQIFLDFLTSGIEHGHMHLQRKQSPGLSPVLLMIGLTIHAVMDGSVLAQPPTGPLSIQSAGQTGLLIGILLHKGPAAAALIIVLMWSVRNKTLLILLLLIFSFASPFGLWLGDVLTRSNGLGDETLLIIIALVSGNFLHISASIFIESDPRHVYDLKKISAGIAGLLLAVAAEFLH